MDQKEITLDTPIQRGESTLNSLIIRSPKKAGHLRGLNTMDIVQMNVDTLIKLLPRITDLTEKEVNDMDPADLLKAGVVVVGAHSRRPTSLHRRPDGRDRHHRPLAAVRDGGHGDQRADGLAPTPR